MDKVNFPWGTISVRDDFELVAFEVIRHAYERGWRDVDFQSVEEYIYNGIGELTEYLFAKRNEAIVWLNENACEDNVYYDYFETVDEDYEGNETPVAGFGVFDIKFKDKE